jgi:uncharacterized protein (TIGR02145 family)
MKKQFLKTAFSTLILSILWVGVNAQVGIGTTTPNASAVLDVTSTTQGLLPPRMTQAQRNAIVSPAAGLMVWCTNCGTAGELQVYNGTTWTNLTGGTASATVPGAPTSPVGTAGNAQASVAFTAPASNGGSAITGYTVTSSPGGFTATGASSPLVVTGLTNGTAYTFTVVATNAAGNSVASAASAAVTPRTVPGAPTSPVATAGNAQASVAFTAPASTGGSAITGYTVTSSPGSFTATGASSPLVVTGLTNGTSYTFTVVATNAAGNSVASTASSSVTPSVPSISGNSTCSGKTISATSCASVSGATINDDGATADGIEYNWTGATTSGMTNTSTTRALVEIGGQCWMRYNMDVIPASFNPAPTWVNSSDVGWSGYYTGGPFTDEGRLYQWTAVMNNSTTERGQGVCPTGWHIPSDCEFMYLENTLGMPVSEQEQYAWRNTGSIGSKLSTVTSSPTNSTGFSILIPGHRQGTDGSYLYRPNNGYYWTSTAYDATTTTIRFFASFGTGSRRMTFSKQSSLAVRCIKD